MLRRLRKASKNTLQLQTTVLADEGMRLLSMVVVVVLGPMELAHGLQVRDCKSVGASAQWYQDQATGDVMKTLVDTFRILRNSAALSDAGFSSSATSIPGTSGGPPPDGLHPAVVFENHAAHLMGELVRSLAAGMMHKVVWHMAGFPGCLAALLCKDAARAPAAAASSSCFAIEQ